MSETLWIAAVVTLLAGLLPWVIGRFWRSARRARFARASTEFHQQREYLEAKFFELASGSGKPRGLAWTRCDFEDDVAYARNRATGELAALVGVTIGFEAVEGGGMEDVQAVGDLRAATAIFQRTRDRWSTNGRVIFNLNPAEAIEFYHEKLQFVAEEPAD